MHDYQHLMQRALNTPVMITERKAAAILSVLAPRLNINQVNISSGGEPAEMSRSDLHALASVARAEDFRAEQIMPVHEGIATIEVSGTLVNKGGLQPSSGITSYSGISTKLQTALNDPMISAIALNIDSSGGEVAGCFDLADEIFQARGQKPIWGILTDKAYSAAYALASACDRIVVPETGGAGSIGVIAMHADYSKALDEAGIVVTAIYAGAQKNDFTPYEPLGDDAKARLQQEIDTLYGIFVERVAGQRNIAVDQIQGTEAGTFLGRAAVDLGLADDVMSSREAYRALLAHAAQSGGPQPASQAAQTDKEVTTMEDKETAAPAAAETASAPAATTPSGASADDERARIGAIMTSEAAEGRKDLANHLAFNTSMSAEDAIATLMASEKKSAEGGLSDKMASVDNPNVGADVAAGGSASHGGVPEVAANAIAVYNREKGLKQAS